MRSLYLLGSLASAVSAYTWANVKIGGGGGFIPGIVFNPTEKGVAYCRADIGGAYKLNSDDSWTAITDFANDTTWHDWGVNAIATDPIDAARVYLLVGMYTNDWDPNDGSVLRSADYGSTWEETKLPFKIGGNEPGRGAGERLAIDPNNNNIIYLAAPSGNGLFKSTDMGVTFTNVTSFTDVGSFEEDPTDTTGYQSDNIGVITVVFDTTSSLIDGATSRIFAATANLNSSSLYVSEDAGSTWSAVTGEPTGYFPRRIKFSAAESALYLAYDVSAGPYEAGDGQVWRYDLNGTWTNITPAWGAANGLTFGYGGLSIDPNLPGTVMVAADNLWWPDVQIFRSSDSGATWTTIWDFVNGAASPHYTETTDLAPWITALRGTDSKVLGWMVESLEIDPFDSNHWLYGTGETIFGGHNLLEWPSVLVESLADGVEEESVQALISPPGGPPLLSAVGDDDGFVHESLTVAPNQTFSNPEYSTTDDLDYAGLAPTNIVRIGNSGSDGTAQISVSTDSGVTWNPMTVSSTSDYGGSVAYGADGTTIVWASDSSVYHFINGVQSTISSLGTGVQIAADKVNPKYYYAADTNSVYVSSDSGATFTTAASVSGAVDIEVHPSVAGDVWLSTSSGIYHSTDFAATFTKVSAVTQAYAIALGKGSGSYPNIYAFATTSTSGGNALQVSSDEGATWTKISDATHGFGSSSSNCLAASQDTEGLVFVGTNGRGIFYGLPSGTSTTSSTTTSSTAKASTSSVKSTSTSSSAKATSTSTTKVSTSSSKTTTTTLVTTTTAAAGGTIPKYYQCGGSGWTGTGMCEAGLTCTAENDFYSQCL